MAITGKFEADFSSFQAAVDGAQVTLRTFEEGSAKAESQLTRMANSLSGTKLIQDATLMVAAVDKVGGVSTLTEAQLAKVGATATEAAAKLVAMGRDVPPGIQAIADASNHAASGSDTLGHSWILRIAEGELLRDAVREVLGVMKEMVEFLPELAMRGAVVGDVEESFKHLATQAGLTSDVLLGTLRAGTHGTVDDFVLMQRANKDMAAGLDLSNAQFGLLAQGAFALAKATGGSTVEALDKMSDALVTGRAKGVAMLTGKIDLKAAEEAYAETLGGTASQLSAEQKLEADRQAILAGVEAGLGRVGEQQNSLKDKVDQGKASWSNFEDELGKAIAQSPVIAAGFDGIKASLAAAFGVDQAHLVEAITTKVNAGAIVVLDFAIAASEGARDFNIAWSLVKSVVLGVETGLMVMAASATSAYAAIAKGASYLPGATKGTDDMAASAKAAADDMWLLVKGLNAETEEAAKGITGHSEFDASLDKLEGGLLNTRDAMIAANTATAASAGPLHAEAAAHGDAADAAGHHADQVLKLSEAQKTYLKSYADAAEHLSAVGTTWQETLKGIDAGLVTDVQTMLAAGASAKDLEIAWGILPPIMKAIEEKTKDMGEAAKLANKQAEDSAIGWATYYKDVAALGHDSVAAHLADTEQWLQSEIAKHVLAKTDTADFYNWVYSVAGAMNDKIIQLNLEADTSTKAHYQKLADTAKAAYDFATAHADQYTDKRLLQLRAESDAAQLTLGDWAKAADAALKTTGNAADDATDKLKKTSDALTASTKAAQLFSMQSAMSAGDLDARAKASGGEVALDSYGNPYVRMPGSPAAGDRYNQAEIVMAGARAEGGAVSAGSSYLVGERGPELFTPSGSGSITPNGSRPTTTIHNYFTVNGTGEDVGRQAMAYITQQMRQGRQFPAA